jgi:lipoyl(octanoyl) transferase
MRQWRLIDDYPTSGARNMAVDEAILQSVSRRESLPTLRLYAWNPPCLSLGYGQRASDVDYDRLSAYGWDVVRRPTGGRAILHTDELTYSLALPIDDDLAAGGIIDSYRRFSAALVAGLEQLGVYPQADHRADRHIPVAAVCFETPSHYEITVVGCKLVGSAQVRRSGGLLQHGSIPLVGDLARICDVLVYPTESERESAKSTVHSRAITLSEALNTEVTWEAASHALIHGFSQTFDIDFIPDTLTPSELESAARLTSDLYSTPAWTLRR